MKEKAVKKNQREPGVEYFEPPTRGYNDLTGWRGDASPKVSGGLTVERLPKKKG